MGAPGDQPRVMRASPSEERADVLIQRFWELEDLPSTSSPLTRDEAYALDHFHDSIQREVDGRYMVKLPRKIPTPTIGESRSVALRRFLSNKKSLMRKGTWEKFEAVVHEYFSLEHAEEVPLAEVEVPHQDCFYLPMHGVSKESSSTTKLRIVFDASAKSSSGVSLNDTLIPGPSLYPKLTTILNRFRRHNIGLSADISKMFREVVLDPAERDYHRFLMSDPNSQEVKTYRMKTNFWCHFIALPSLQDAATGG